MVWLLDDIRNKEDNLDLMRRRCIDDAGGQPVHGARVLAASRIIAAKIALAYSRH